MSNSRFATAQEAEDAFYRAFARADLEAMMEVWADDETITCIHPAGPRLDGRSAIRRSWQAIFHDPAGIEFVLTDARRIESGELVVHLVLERVREGKEHMHHVPVIATNVYRLTQYGWRMVLHHASVPPLPQKPAQEQLH